MSDKPSRSPIYVARAFTATPYVAVHSDVWHPPTDVYETDTEIIIKVDIAGIDEGNMEVELEDGLLRVHGHRSDCSAFSKLAVHRMEISCGEFETHVHLPHAVDGDAEVECIYSSGMLTITLVKELARKVQVRTEQ